MKFKFMIRNWWGKLTRLNPWYKSKIDSFESFCFPVIKEVFPELLIKDFVSIQPLSFSEKPSNSQFEILDSNNPKIGQVFTDGFIDSRDAENPPLCGCCCPRWHKIFTPTGWIYEKKDKKSYEEAYNCYALHRKEKSK